jgi:hypothetical protein
MDKSPFRQTFQGGFAVDTFVEMCEMEIARKRGLVADGWLKGVRVDIS